MSRRQPVIPVERAASRIYLIRDEKIMLDGDLAELYDAPTSALNQQVKRNMDRVPQDSSFGYLCMTASGQRDAATS